MKYEELQKRALEIRAKYDTLNKTKGRPAWTAGDFMAGFVGDVGELSELVMAKRGMRDVEDVDAKLAHELVDCLWSVIVLADKYNIDLPQEFGKTMDALDARIQKQL